jgi:hypothetical protein
MTRIQTLPFDAKIVLGGATARSFAFVAHSFNGACGGKFKFYGQVFVETTPEATDDLIMPGAQDPGIKAGRSLSRSCRDLAALFYTLSATIFEDSAESYNKA